MNTIRHFVILIAIVTMALPEGVLAAGKAKSTFSTYQTVGIGVRRQSALPAFEEWPFGENDMSFGGVYEYHDEMGFWQVGLTYTPSPTGSNALDYAITPEVNLVLSEGIWQAGVGVLKSFIPAEDEAAMEAQGIEWDDWTDFYYHIIAGVGFPLGQLGLEIHAVYTFDDWGDVSEFDVGDMEYQAWLTYQF